MHGSIRISLDIGTLIVLVGNFKIVFKTEQKNCVKNHNSCGRPVCRKYAGSRLRRK